MKCTNCGSKNKNGLAFCENCGNPLTAAKPKLFKKAAASRCPNCHEEVRPGLKFCENCGTQLLIVTRDSEIPISIKPKRGLPKIHLRDKLSRLSGAISANPYRAILIVLCVIAIIFGSIWGIDKLGNSISRSQADGMAQGIVSAVFPQLADVKPSISVFKQADHNVVSYNYSKQINVELADGNVTNTTAGLIINVDRKTGKVDLIQFP